MCPEKSTEKAIKIDILRPSKIELSLERGCKNGIIPRCNKNIKTPSKMSPQMLPKLIKKRSPETFKNRSKNIPQKSFKMTSSTICVYIDMMIYGQEKKEELKLRSEEIRRAESQQASEVPLFNLQGLSLKFQS